MDNKFKEWIDQASYYDLLFKWRFAHVGDPIFIGDVGEYFGKVINKKREEIGNDEHVKISKMIGWER